MNEADPASEQTCVRRFPLISRRSSNSSLARELLPYVNAVPSRGPRIRDTGHNVTLAKVKGHSRHRVALSGARDYESSASLHASDTEANVRGIRPWRDEDGGRWGRGRGEGDRWVCCRTGYLTNVRPKPARVGYKRVFCNAPSSEFSPHKASPLLLPLPLPVLPFFLSFLRVASTLPLHDRKFQVLWSGYCRRDTCGNTLRALCTLAVSARSRTESR